MIINEEEFLKAKNKDLIECKCDYCDQIFYRKKKILKQSEKQVKQKHVENKNAK